MDTHESTTDVSANQMLCDVMNMRKEADEPVRDCISALLRKNRMLEIIGVDYPALCEQLFLAEGLSTEQLEARILEGTERLEIERAQDTCHVSILLGSLQHEISQVKMKTSGKPLKAYAQIASTPITSKSPNPVTPVPDFDPKHVAKTGLTLERLGYPSSERVLILAKDPAYGLGLPPNLSKAALSTADYEIYQIGKSHKNLHMNVTATS